MFPSTSAPSAAANRYPPASQHATARVLAQEPLKRSLNCLSFRLLRDVENVPKVDALAREARHARDHLRQTPEVLLKEREEPRICKVYGYRHAKEEVAELEAWLVALLVLDVSCIEAARLRFPQRLIAKNADFNETRLGYKMRKARNACLIPHAREKDDIGFSRAVHGV